MPRSIQRPRTVVSVSAAGREPPAVALTVVSGTIVLTPGEARDLAEMLLNEAHAAELAPRGEPIDDG